MVDDTQILNEDFKKNVAIPYFKDIYKDLVQQSDNKQKGINKLSTLTVSMREVLRPKISTKWVDKSYRICLNSSQHLNADNAT